MTTVIQMIETSGPGGAENVMVRLSVALKEQGIRPIVLMLKEGWLTDELRHHEIEVSVLPVTNAWDLGWTHRAMKLVRHYKADMLHAHEFTMNCYGALMSRLWGIPCIATLHGKSYYGDRLRRRLAYRIAARWTQFVAVSDDVRDFATQRIGVPTQDIEIVRNGICVSNYAADAAARDSIRHELGLSGSDILVGAIGSLYPVKGHKFLVQAAETLLNRYDNLSFFIAGRGRLQESLQAEIEDKKFGGRFQLLGFRADVTSLLQATDIYVMPSLSEGLPLSLLEAMASGKAIVASDVGGIGEVISSQKSGLLVEPGSATQLVSAISNFVAYPDIRRTFGCAAQHEVSSNFGMSKMVEQYCNLYGKLIGAHHR